MGRGGALVGGVGWLAARAEQEVGLGVDKEGEQERDEKYGHAHTQGQHLGAHTGWSWKLGSAELFVHL